MEYKEEIETNKTDMKKAFLVAGMFVLKHIVLVALDKMTEKNK
jgi:hypothetical protein